MFKLFQPVYRQPTDEGRALMNRGGDRPETYGQANACRYLDGVIYIVPQMKSRSFKVFGGLYDISRLNAGSVEWDNRMRVVVGSTKINFVRRFCRF